MRARWCPVSRALVAPCEACRVLILCDFLVRGLCPECAPDDDEDGEDGPSCACGGTGCRDCLAVAGWLG